MRCLSKNFFKPILGGILFLGLLAGCGPGGDGSSSGGGSGSGTSGSSSIKSLEAYTDSDGIASFTLSNGKTETIQIIDQQTGNSIEGLKVTLISDGTEGFYMLSDENNDNYVPKIINISSTNSNKNVNKASSLESSVTVTVTSWEQVIVKDAVVLVSQDKIPSHLWQYFVENKTKRIDTIKVDEIFNYVNLLKNSFSAGKKYVNILYAAKVTVFMKIGFLLTVGEIANDIELYNIERAIRNDGYSPGDYVDIFEYKPGLYLFVPQKEPPNPNNYASIRGCVTDTSGNPVELAWIKLLPYVEPQRTDNTNGCYIFLNNIPVYGQSTEYTITVDNILSFESPKPMTFPVSPGDILDVSIILKPYNPLEPLGKIINLVKDATNGSILDGVIVRSYNANTQRLSDSQLTLSDGTAQLNVNEGTHDLVFSKEDYETKPINNVAVTANQTDYKEILLQKKMMLLSPVISSVTPTPIFTAVGGSSTITCNAYDPDGDYPLTYSWTYARGTISGSASGPVVTWISPSTAGTYTVTCNVLDSTGKSASRDVNIDVSETTAPLSFTSTFLSSGKVGFAYVVNLYAAGGKTPYNWSIISGTLPPGLSLSTSGTISGTPSTAGAYNFSIQVSDSGLPQQTVPPKSFSITIINPPTTADTNPPSTPTNLVATAVSSSQIDLYWAASIDNAGISGYRIYRNGTYIKSVNATSTSDTGLNSSTQYCYTVSAYDAAGNESGQSISQCATTFSIAQTLSVSSFTATPSSGVAPLNGMDLTSAIGGTATGTINYTFYCNRSDTGTNITSGWAAKYDGVTANPMTALDACNYSTSGTYTAKVIVERGSAPPAEARATVTVSSAPAPTLTITSFTASPSSGTAPLNGVDLTATVGGTATGTINYTFYCNRSDTGTNVTTGWAAKYDGVTTNPMTALDACNYSTSGTYTAKVIVERGTQAAEARTTITADSILPAPNLISPFNGSTNQSTTPTFTWSLVSGATSYRIMVATSLASLPTDPNASTCSGCVINVTPSINSYTPVSGVLSPGTTYYWQVKARGATIGAWSSQWRFTTQ